MYKLTFEQGNTLVVRRFEYFVQALFKLLQLTFKNRKVQFSGSIRDNEGYLIQVNR